MNDTTDRRLALFGRDHGQYGSYELRGMSGTTVAVITVGADDESPSRRFKGDPSVPNEDALLVIDDDARRLLAVADGHFGHEASHDLILALAGIAAVPASADALHAVFSALASRPPAEQYSARTALLAAVFDAGTGTGFGLSFGDCTLAIVGPGRGAVAVNAHDAPFVTPVSPELLAPDRGRAFEFTAGAGDLLLVFSDGIDGCHYGHPDTSVRPEHLAQLFDRHGDDPERYAPALIELAMAGVDGNPGGQDNIALIAARA